MSMVCAVHVTNHFAVTSSLHTKSIVTFTVRSTRQSVLAIYNLVQSHWRCRVNPATGPRRVFVGHFQLNVSILSLNETRVDSGLPARPYLPVFENALHECSSGGVAVFYF